MQLVPPRREALVCLLVCLAASPLLVGRDTSEAAAAPAEPGGCGVWMPPVDGPVVRAFKAPAFAYGPGHRGIDFAAAAGTPVRASDDGVVAFTGSVAGSLHVVVAHDGNLRTTYAFLAGIGVGRGTASPARSSAPPEARDPSTRQAGSISASVSATGTSTRSVSSRRVISRSWSGSSRPTRCRPSPGTPARGVRVADLGRVGRRIRRRRPRRRTRRRHRCCRRRGPERVGRHEPARQEWQRAALARVAGVGARAGRGLVGVASTAVGHTPTGIVASVAADIAAGTADWWRHRQECSDGATAADGTGGSGHLLMAVGGIDTVGAPDEPTFGLDTRALGYRDDEVRYFSYAPDGGAYRAPQTHGDLQRAGLRLAEQLKEAQREHPGREVDLIAHSQGGVVVDVFLQDYYDAADPMYPPIGTVVTLSSPHEGSPLATAAADWHASSVGRALVDEAEERLPVAPSSSAPSVRQLDEHSRFLRDLWDAGLPEHVDFTTVGASDDVLVPATQVDVPDATKVVVDVGGRPLDDHTNIPRDPGALRVVRAALEGRAPPCVGVVEGLRGVVVPTLITRVEHGLGELPVVSR